MDTRYTKVFLYCAKILFATIAGASPELMCGTILYSSDID